MAEDWIANRRLLREKRLHRLGAFLDETDPETPIKPKAKTGKEDTR
jgi:hypothetical protein